MAGSIPAQGLLDIHRFRVELEHRPRPKDLSESAWRLRIDKLTFAHRDSWLDDRPAVRHLDDPQLAGAVVDALYFFAGLLEWPWLYFRALSECGAPLALDQ